jgi:hypothetical protein
MRLFILYLLLINNLIAKQSFEATVKIEEINLNGIIKYSEKKDILFIDNKIKQNIKYKEILKVILKKINSAEKRYTKEDLFLINTIYDKYGNIWTVSITVTSKDISVSHFVSKQKSKTINGWINRDNKDIFGLRLFNF